jgi:uncharacterized protein
MKRNLTLCIIIFNLLLSSSIIAQSTQYTLYREDSLIIVTENVDIHGKLLLPNKKQKKWSLAIIIPGSGATDMDGNNKAAGLHSDAYKQLAHALLKNNIAFFRYDKSGVGLSKSKKTTNRVFDDEFKDVQAIIDFFKKDKRFSSITIIGHSQGSLVGMLASKKANKFISVAGLGYAGNVTLKRQLSTQPSIVSEKATRLLIVWLLAMK